MRVNTVAVDASTDAATIAQTVLQDVCGAADRDDTDTGLPGRAATVELPELGRISDGRWLLLQELGAGNRTWIVAALDIAARPFLDCRGRKPPAWALKVACVPTGADCPADLEHEARVLARASDVPGIADAYGLQRMQGLPMLRMTVAPGRRLADILPLGRQAALNVLRELAGTLVILHRRGIAHGDLKPGNILVARDCAPTLIDFGSAHDSQGAGPPPLLTRTPAWAGPGQMRGHPATAADDVFAFAMLCYRLLENTHPFNGHSVATARDAGHARPSLRRGGRRLRRLVNSVLGGHPASAEDFDAELTSLEGKRL